MSERRDEVEPFGSDAEEFKQGAKLGQLGRVHEDTFQSFLAEHLAVCINLPLPMKIRMVCEAALSVPWKNDKFLEGIRVLAAQNTAIENFYTWNSEGLKVYSVRWAGWILDSERKYKTFFEEWAIEPEAHASLMSRKAPDGLDKLPVNERFELRTRFMTDNGFYSLRNLFLSSAEVKIMDIFRKTSYFIDPSVLKIPQASSFR